MKDLVEFKTFEEARQADIKYMIALGRRQPMHIGHLATLKKIMDEGMFLICAVGSTNTAERDNGLNDPSFNPISNPLTFEQQRELLLAELAKMGKVEGKDFAIQNFPDLGDNPAWCKKVVDSTKGAIEIDGKYPDISNEVAWHYIGKPEDMKHVVTKDADGNEVLGYYWEKTFREVGFPVLSDRKHEGIGLDLSATQLRVLDLNNLTDEQKAKFADWEYIRDLANKARESNPDKDLLQNLPVTMFDLSLERLYKEKNINTAEIYDDAARDKPYPSLEDLTASANKLNKSPKLIETARLKLAAASENQTGGDWHRNLKNNFASINKAKENGANLLVLGELTLTGYERGDDFYYQNNEQTLRFLNMIALYAQKVAPELLISIGHPYHIADKSIPASVERRKNPIYNRLNQNFNVQSLIGQGKILAMSAKSYLFTYERGYEGRHFAEWSEQAANNYSNEYGQGREGTIFIKLPSVNLDGIKTEETVIPFGSPVVQLKDGDKAINLWTIICEMYWVGSEFDESPGGAAAYLLDNPLAQKVKEYDVSIALNPNASPPSPNKIDKHRRLCELASKVAGVIVHSDGLGSSGSTFAQFGSRLIAQDGKIIAEGKRISFRDMAYTSQIVDIPLARDKGKKPHAVIDYSLAKREMTPPVIDGPAKWESSERREFEEELRCELLWQFDYVRKNKITGLSNALSGGADSVHNTVKVRLMIELAMSELGVEGFLEAMSYLPYKADIERAYKAGGKEAAIQTTMENFLTVIYLGTSNSSPETLRGGETLIKGGVREDGTTFKGIGGKFHYRNIERLVEIYAQIFSGVDTSKITDEQDLEIRKELAGILKLRKEDTTPDQLKKQVDDLKAKFEIITHEVMSVANDRHITAYENLQASIRGVFIRMLSNIENKVPIANPNLDEARNSYATFGGDLHSGMISGNAHKNKSKELKHLRYLMEYGLEDDVAPISAIYWALKNRPSAELLPKGKDGKVVQFDEDQLGRTFDEMEAIANLMLYERRTGVDSYRKNNPTEVFERASEIKLFDDLSIEDLHDKIRLSYDRWAISQFKIHASPIAHTYGKSVDHQSSMRTPNTSGNFRPELAVMALNCLAKVAQREGKTFEDLSGGKSLNEMCLIAETDRDFADALGSKMWTPQATDGRKMKLGTLYKFAVVSGLDSLPRDKSMQDIISVIKGEPIEEKGKHEAGLAATPQQAAQRN